MVSTVVDGMFNKGNSGVNVTSGALSVRVCVVVELAGSLSHCHSGGLNVYISFMLTTNTSNGGAYVDNNADP